ncbi:MAG: 3-oxoacyl-[acyl-carrier-protein] reductase [Candidatus Kapaibacteriales bacterium]
MEVAIVTGGIKGIGAAISEKLANEGVTVIALGRSGTQEDAQSIHSNVHFQSCDVSDTENVKEVFDGIAKEHGSIDYLINNAGVTKDGLLMRMSEKDWDAVIDINLKGVFNTSKAVCRQMMGQRSGRIVNIGSIVGSTGNAGQSNYSASKAGLIGFTKSMAKELASRGILVNLVAPGYVQTSMTDKLSEEQVKAFADSIPLKRAGNPEEIAETVWFFCSPASSYITGQVVHVDGGLAM